MAQAAIHDAYDTILILDFGSQVHKSRSLRTIAIITNGGEKIVQPFDHEKMS